MSISDGPNRFGFLKFVIVIYLLFVICYLRFGIFLRNQKVSFSIKLAAFQASGGIERGTVNL
jgi:hypothetical protein